MSDFFRLPEILSPGNRRESLPHTRFSHAQFVSVLVPACCRSCTVILSLTSRTDPTHTRGSMITEHIVSVLHQKSHLIAQCHVLHLT